jgi:hypothetical protein
MLLHHEMEPEVPGDGCGNSFINLLGKEAKESEHEVFN